MQNNISKKWFIIECSNHFTIKKVYYSFIDNYFEESKNIINYIDPKNGDSFLHFVFNLKNIKTVFENEITFKLPNDSYEIFIITGLEIGIDRYLIWGTKGDLDIYEELLSINNEQINILRKELKQAYKKGINNHTVDHFTKINNELINTKRELIKKNINLENLYKEKNRLLGMIAHDLRNPLAAINSYSDYIISTTKQSCDSIHIEFIEIIKNISKYTLDMVNDILDYSKIDSGKLTLDKKDIDINTILEELNIVYSKLAELKNIKLVFNKSTSLKLSLDKIKILQVIGNILDNSIKYSYSNSKIYFKGYIDEKNYIISIKDEGQGISEKDLNNLFIPFQKGNSKTTAGESSSGLGLYIANKIIKAHNGAIDVKSELKIGTIFNILLPIN